MQINGVHIQCKEYFEQEIQSAIARNELAAFLGVLDRLARYTKKEDRRVRLFSDFSNHGFVACAQQREDAGSEWTDSLTIGIIHDPERNEQTWGFHT